MWLGIIIAVALMTLVVSIDAVQAKEDMKLFRE